MHRKLTDFYSYIFQEDQQSIAVYFQTKTGTEYRVYFYPLLDYFDVNPETLISKTGYFFGFTKLKPNEDKKEDIDIRIRNTIIQIINDFFKSHGSNNILIFYCDDADKKNYKRSSCFENWYTLSETEDCFNKHDEEIEIYNEYGEIVDTHFMSLIIGCNNVNNDLILAEFQNLKEQFVKNK